ncbi:hypothetical protein [Billgrantia antri]|uniref:Dihydroorotate dehydrogenase catalytic domain-containing protein n=1 Tax=Billgrantia antri TaxID=2846777 RepID=A0ABS6ZLU5_9GAMM|nr:hypothetical protein [Halomonas antri]MBW6389899.1 hypothetical protein [Halomonas antri]
MPRDRDLPRWLMAALMRQAPRLGRGIAQARVHWAARLGSPPVRAGRPAGGDGDPPAPVKAMGLAFPNPLGIAAGFDRRGRLGRRAAALGFGCIEIGSWSPHAGAALCHPPSAGDAVLGINVGLGPRTSTTHALDDLLAGLREAWRHADYVAVNLGSPQAAALLCPSRLGELQRLLGSLKGQQRRLADCSGNWVPLAIKLRMEREATAPPPIVKHLEALGFEGLILACDAGPPATLQRYADWRLPERQRQACHQVAQAAELLDGRLPLISVGGIATAEHVTARLDAGAMLVQLHDALVYEGPWVARALGNAAPGRA